MEEKEPKDSMRKDNDNKSSCKENETNVEKSKDSGIMILERIMRSKINHKEKNDYCKG